MNPLIGRLHDLFLVWLILRPFSGLLDLVLDHHLASFLCPVFDNTFVIKHNFHQPRLWIFQIKRKDNLFFTKFPQEPFQKLL